MKSVVTAHAGLYWLFVVLYRILYVAEQLLVIAVRFPGAARIRRTSPGLACSKLSGVVYHGSLLGGITIESITRLLIGLAGSAQEAVGKVHARLNRPIDATRIWRTEGMLIDTMGVLQFRRSWKR